MYTWLIKCSRQYIFFLELLIAVSPGEILFGVYINKYGFNEYMDE